MARLGGTAATSATGDPRGQGSPCPTAYTPGGCQWGSELDTPRTGEAKPRAISPSIPLPGGPVRPTPPRGLARVALGLPTSPMGTAFMEGRQEGKMVVLAAELSGLCGKILARLDQVKYATGKLPSGILPCPTQPGSRRQLGLYPCSRTGAWTLRAWPGPSSSPPWGAQSIYSAQLTLNKTLSRDILFSSPLP